MKKIFFILSCTLLLFSQLVYSQFIETAGGPEGGVVYALEKVGNEIWAASDRGIYFSINEGVTWNLSPIIDNKKVFNIFSQGDTVLVFYGVPVMPTQVSLMQIRSIDGGQTWSSPVTLIPNTGANDVLTLHRNYHILLLEIWSSKLVSNDMGLSWNTFVPPSAGNIYKIESDKYTIASFLTLTPNSNKALYVSTDSLQTWQLVDTSFQVHEMFVDSNLILVSAIESSGAGSIHKLFRSIDAGQSWTFIDSFAANLYFHKLYEDTLYIFLQDTALHTLASYDKGLTWNTIPTLDMTIFDPIFVTGGILDCYGYWNVKKYIPSLNQNYPSYTGIKSERISFIKSHQNVLYTKGINWSFRSFDGGSTWHKIDSLSVPSIHPRDFHFKGDSIFVISGNHFYRSFDNGTTWAHFTGVYGTNITRLNNELYVGSNSDSVYKSSDWGTTWQTLPTINPTNEGGYVLAFQDSVLFAAIWQGDVYKFNQSTQTWSPSLLSSSQGSTVRLFDIGGTLVYSGTGTGQLYISTNGGNTWTHPHILGLPTITNIGGTLDTLMPQYIALYNGLWLGSVPNYGFYTSSDNGDNWQALQMNALPFNNADFTIMNDVIYAASAHSSVWRSAGTITTISGNVYYDLNNNGTKDAGESDLPYKILVSAPTDMYALTDSNGHYAMISIATGDSLKPVLNNYATHSNPTGLLTNGQNQIQDFGLFIPPNLADLKIDMTNVSPFQPGFDTYLVLNCTNEGSLAQNALIKFLPDTNLVIISTSPAVSSQIGDTLVWNSNMLNYGQSISISILVNTDISLSVGDSLLCQAWVLPVANDITPNNNQSLLNEAIFASYDPNDKNCSWGTQINTTQVQDGEEFIYTIRFQNTGNFPTSFVFIEDTLDYHFDISTFHVISTSHPMNYELSGQGNLKFTFNPLNLPPVSINEAESHGFVKYGIRCKQPTEVGAGITNTAYIYFDFNSPIITNTTSTQVVLPEETTLAIPHILEGDIPIGWIIYPNPAQTILHIDFDENAAIEGNILLMDYTGKLLLTQAIHDENVILALNNFTKGLYLCVLTDKKGRYLATIKVVLNP